MQFVNLYLESEYTMLGSSIKIDELMAFAKQNNIDTLAICDLDNMHGVLKFYLKCKENNIKPIIGLHLTLESEYNYYNSILLYSKDYEGYLNLIKISTIRKLNKKLFFNDIINYLNNIIIILPNEENELIKSYKENNTKAFENILITYKKVKDLFVGIDLQTLEMKYDIQNMITTFSNYGIKQIAIHKTSYLYQDDFKVYKVLKCIDKNIKDYNQTEKEQNMFFPKTEAIVDAFRKYPELVNQTKLLADACNVEIKFEGYKMPVYSTELNTKDYLVDLAFIGLKKRLKDNQIRLEDYQKYIDRLTYELKIIEKMGFCDYFLIVYDFIKYAKKEGILVGPGRGSAPSSLVAYSLGITEIDPLEYNLLFERFLNPERSSMPDIDTDFPDTDRPIVIKHMMEKYGKMRVAHICTFGTYGPRLAVRDVARVLELKQTYLDEILHCVSDSGSFKDILEHNELYKRMYDEDEVIRYVTDICLKMEGLPRNTSVHAAGIIMADDDLTCYTPLDNGINGLYQTQYDAEDLEKLGLVKIDFLGIKNLSTIDKVLKSIKQDINIYKLPLNDKETFKLIASGNTNGIFQLESSGMKNTLAMLKASEFNDIVNALALYRPGPMEMIPSFVNRKFGREKIEYLHEDLKDILAPTYGIIVYQEQILLIASKFAGYTLGEADVLRRAVSKKKADLLASEEEKFITKAQQKGKSYEISKKIFEYILKFANYGFNKSHSVAYSMVSYQMAFLKKHCFKEFMAVIMSDKIGSISHIKSYILECNKAGIEVVIPSINKSGIDFVVENNKIYYSLLGINGLGETIIRNLLNERENGGLYKTYDEFILRTKDILNKKHVEALIYSGALDELKLTRKAMIDEYNQSLQLANYGETFRNQLSEHIFDDKEYSFEEIANFESYALGFNLKFDIFRKYAPLKKKYNVTNLENVEVNKFYTILFAVKRVKEIITKNEEKMAFILVSDNTAELDCVLFPKVYEKANITLNKVYLGYVKIEVRKDAFQGVINKIAPID